MPARAIQTAKRLTAVAKRAQRTTTSPAPTPPAPRPRGDSFVQTVLDATLAELADGGYESLSIPGIAEKANANKTSLYRRWPSKDDLIRDALLSVMPQSADIPNTGHLQGDLLALARSVASFTQSRAGIAIIRIMLAQGQHSQLRAMAEAAYGEAGKQGPWLVMQRAQQRGELKPGTDPSLILFTLAGGVMHRVFVERRPADDAFVERLVGLIVGGASTEV
jgi:AcrR family transcriptional regulator